MSSAITTSMGFTNPGIANLFALEDPSPWDRWKQYEYAVNIEGGNPQLAQELYQELGAQGMLAALNHILPKERSRSNNQLFHIFYEALCYSQPEYSNTSKHDWSTVSSFKRLFLEAASRSTQGHHVVHDVKTAQRLATKRLTTDRKQLTQHLKDRVHLLGEHPLFVEILASNEFKQKQYTKAIEGYRIALRLGNVRAIVGLQVACLHAKQELEPHEKVLAAASRRDGKDKTPFVTIGENYSQGIDDFLQDNKKAERWMRVGSKIGEKHIQESLGITYLERDMFVDAYPYLTAAANQGKLDAQLHLRGVLRKKLEEEDLDGRVRTLFEKHMELLLDEQLPKHGDPTAHEAIAIDHLQKGHFKAAFLAINRCLHLGGNRFDLRVHFFALGWGGVTIDLKKAQADLIRFRQLQRKEKLLLDIDPESRLDCLECMMQAFAFAKRNLQAHLPYLSQIFQEQFPDTCFKEFSSQATKLTESEDDLLRLLNDAISRDDQLSSNILMHFANELEIENRKKASKLLQNTKIGNPKLFAMLCETLKDQLLMPALGLKGVPMNLEKSQADLMHFRQLQREGNFQDVDPESQLGFLECIMQAFVLAQINPQAHLPHLSQIFKKKFPDTSFEEFSSQAKKELTGSEDELLRLLGDALSQDDQLSIDLLVSFVDELEEKNQRKAYKLLQEAAKENPTSLSLRRKVAKTQILMRGSVQSFSDRQAQEKAFTLMRKLKEDPLYDPYDLAMVFLEGTLCEKNVLEAIKYLKRSLELNNYTAAYDLGLIYFKQEDPDYSSAVEYLTIAADSGVSSAWADLCIACQMLWKGNGDPQLLQQSTRALGEAIQCEDGRGYFYWGQLQSNNALARPCFDKACELDPSLHSSVQIFYASTKDAEPPTHEEADDEKSLSEVKPEHLMRGIQKRLLQRIDDGASSIPTRNFNVLCKSESSGRREGGGSRVRLRHNNSSGVQLNIDRPHARDRNKIRGARLRDLGKFLKKISKENSSSKEE